MVKPAVSTAIVASLMTGFVMETTIVEIGQTNPEMGVVSITTVIIPHVVYVVALRIVSYKYK